MKQLPIFIIIAILTTASVTLAKSSNSGACDSSVVIDTLAAIQHQQIAEKQRIDLINKANDSRKESMGRVNNPRVKAKIQAEKRAKLKGSTDSLSQIGDSTTSSH